MNKLPLISVIIPAFNCENYIDQALRSIINQSYQNLEILVCDDASTDNTWTILQSYTDKRLKLLRNEVNTGLIGSKNLLLSNATGEYFAFQDADDWSDTHRLEVQWNEFLSDPTLGACCTNFIRINSKGTQATQNLPKSGYLKLDDFNDLTFCPATLMIKKCVYEEVGGLHPFFSRLYAEDIYWLSLIANKYKTLIMSPSLYYYRFNENSVTNTFDNQNKLVIIELVEELILQRRNTGTDWLEQNDNEAIEKFIKGKFENKKWLAEKCRIFAAVQQDGGKKKASRQLIRTALKLNPWNPLIYRTLAYIYLKGVL